MTIKLNDTQLVLLSAASQRHNGLVMCQSALERDPGSACNRDPSRGGRSARRSWSGLRRRADRGGAWVWGPDDQARFLKRQLSLPVSTMSQ